MNLKVRLALMNFLEFAVWGSYLTSMGQYLGRAGMGAEISWFYAIQGIVSIFMPTIMGVIADRLIQPQRLLGLCHLIAGCFMVSLFLLGNASPNPDKTLFISLYTLSVAFYMPTLALSNTAAFAILKSGGLDTVKDFPPIRVFGTVGFIATMWFVNCAFLDGGNFGLTLSENAGKFQYTHLQFLVSGILGFVLFLYCFTLPECKLAHTLTHFIYNTLKIPGIAADHPENFLQLCHKSIDASTDRCHFFVVGNGNPAGQVTLPVINFGNNLIHFPVRICKRINYPPKHCHHC